MPSGWAQNLRCSNSCAAHPRSERDTQSIYSGVAVPDSRVATEHNTHGGWEVEAQANSASNRTLACPIRAENHVEVWTRAELHIVVGKEVLELYPDNRSGDKTWIWLQ